MSVPFLVCVAAASAANGEPSFGEQIKKINQEARAAREGGDLEKVEQIRHERWRLLGQVSSNKKTPESPWISAYKAIELVDGSEHSTDKSTGLFNALHYKQSCDILKSALEEMMKAGDDPVLGELATRYFEISQQAKSIYRDALVPGAPNQVADVSDVGEKLQIASSRDPCCVLATPMLQYLQQAHPDEAFLRAEVRSDFKEKQRQLVNLSHGIILPPSKEFRYPYRSELLKAPPPVVPMNTPPGASKPEGVNLPLMPWHAPVELVKVKSLRFLLQDLEYARSLAPDYQQSEFLVPSNIYAGLDASLLPCQFLYGNQLLMRGQDEGGGRRSLVYFPRQDKGKKTVNWDYRYLDLIWRVPSSDEVVGNSRLRAKQEMLGQHTPRKRWKLGEQEFYIFDYPIRDTERLLEVNTQLLCVRNKDDLAEIKYSALQNQGNAISRLETRADRQFPNMPFATTAAVTQAIKRFQASNDPTKNALIELLRNEQLNPLVLVSERVGSAGGGVSTPNLYPGEDKGKSPYIVLDDGSKIRFSLQGSEQSPCAFIEFKGATAYFPMSNKAIPRPLLVGADMGRAFVAVLVAAGYTEQEAVEEIVKAMNVDGEYLPVKVRQLLTARVVALAKEDAKITAAANAEKNRQDQENRRFAELNPWLAFVFQNNFTAYKQTPRAELQGMVAKAMLAEQGWFGDVSLKSGLDAMYRKYGFRYLRDNRGNWILSRSLVADDGSSAGISANQKQFYDEARSSSGASASAEKFKDYPYAFFAQDGKLPVDIGQIYSWSDYERLKDNIYNEHLRKVLLFAPSLAVVDLIDFDQDDPLVHPEDRTPAYLTAFAASMKSRLELLKKQPSSSPGIGPANSGGLELGMPFPRWMVAGDQNQAVSLANLHNAYMQRILGAARESRKRRIASQALSTLLAAALFAGQGGMFSEETKADIEEAIRLSREVMYANSGSFSKDVNALLAIQLDSARDFARRRYYHKSIIWYNDLLSQLYPDTDVSRYGGTSFFRDVPSSEAAQKFVRDLGRLVTNQSLVMNVQVELGGVLNAAGLGSSAQMVWQRTIDDYEFLFKPAIVAAEDLLASYGLRLPKAEGDVFASLEDVVTVCGDSIEKYGLAVDWRKRMWSVGGNKQGRRPGSAEQVLAALERERNGQLGDADKERLNDSIERLSNDRGISFAEWLAFKRALIQFRPVAAFRSTALSAPWFAVPCDYDAAPGRGFAESIDAAEKLVVKANAEAINEWCRKPVVAEANRESIAADASALAGWFFVDTGQFPEAREAFMNLARIKKSTAKTKSGTIDGLVDELHGYSALLAASAVVDSLPGLGAYRSDFSALLEGQLSGWEKRWFAQGNYGPHAAQQNAELKSRASRNRSAVAAEARSWHKDRYVFPDYSGEFGAVPDYLVMKLLQSPQLFTKMDDAVIKAREGRAVQDLDWVLITEQDASDFLDKHLVVDSELQKDVVSLGGLLERGNR